MAPPFVYLEADTPYPNEHAARVKPPSAFIPDSFRRKRITDGVTLIVGRLKDGEGSAVAQSYRFDREQFTAGEARAWLKEHDVMVQLFEEATGEEKAIGLGTASSHGEVMPSRQAQAKQLLQEAIRLHDLHIDDPETATPDSQVQLMRLIEQALSALTAAEEESSNGKEYDGSVMALSVMQSAIKQDEKPYKTVDGVRLHAEDFASVGDMDEPGTWKLPLAEQSGSASATRIAGAITALQPGGFRGQHVTLSAPKASVIRRISAAIGKLDDEDAQDRLRERLSSVKEWTGKAEKAKLGGIESNEQRENEVRRALEATVAMPMPEALAVSPRTPWIVDTYPTSVICEWGGKFYQVAYARMTDGYIEFAPQEEWVEMEKREEWIAKVKARDQKANRSKQHAGHTGPGGPHAGHGGGGGGGLGGIDLDVDPDGSERESEEKDAVFALMAGAALPESAVSTLEAMDDAGRLRPEEHDALDNAELAKNRKAGRRVRSDKVGMLRDIKAAFEAVMQKVAEVIGWADYEDQKPKRYFQSLKTFKGSDGRDWLLTWTTNGFEDRDGEIFETKAIEEYVERHASEQDKGPFRFWHIPGSDFATIKWQGVSGRFLVEAGPFNDTDIGRAFNEFFSEYPDGHPAVAPTGWGTSHGFLYRPEDRKGGVYRWFEKKETSILPASVAANPFNPEMEVIQMLTKEQIKALEEIGGASGKDLVKLVTDKGEKTTEELEQAGIAHKAKNAGDVAAMLRAMADDMEDEEMAKEVRSLATKLSKSGKKDAEGTPGEIDVSAAVKALVAKAKGESKKKLKALAAELEKEPDEAPPEGSGEPAEEPQPEEAVKRGEVEQAIKVIGGAVAGLAELVKAISDQQAAIVKALDIKVEQTVKATLQATPRASLAELAAKSVIGRKETEVDGRSALAKDKPDETDPGESGGRRGFGIEVLDSIKALNQRAPAREQ